MKVLTVSANKLKTPYPVFPLGVDQVAGVIAPEHDLRVIDMGQLGGVEEIAELTRQFAPDLVGIGIRNIDNTDLTDSLSFVDECREIARELRRATAAPLVLGGAGFTVFPDEMMQVLDANFGVVGEGERLTLLIEALSRNDDPAQLPGIVTRESTACAAEPWAGEIRRPRTACVDPAPYLAAGGMFNLQSKRGCPHQCIYCTYPGIEGHEQRLFPPTAVGQTARALQDAGAKFLFITDATFNSATEHSLAVAEAMKEHGVSIPWGAFFTPLHCADDYYARLADAGLSHVEFGTDSLCDPVLQAYQKPFRLAQVERAHQAATAAGLAVAHYLMLGGPGEDRSTVAQTLSVAESLADTVLFFFCGVRIYPHTALYDLACQQDLIRPEQSLLRPVFYHSEALAGQDLEAMVRQQARGRLHWIIGSGGKKLEKLMVRMYQKGHTGPLWEKLIR